MSVRTSRSALGSETSTSVSTDCDGGYGDHPRGHRGQRLDPVAAAREDEQPVAVQEQLVARRRVERERVEQARLRAADVDGVQLPVRDREERLAVRLDEVGLVDALLLDVRAGEVDALLAAAPRAGAAARRGRSRRCGTPPPKPVRADEARRLRLRVAEQLAARAERDQARRLRGLRPEPSGRWFRRAAAASDDRQRREERDASARSSSPWLYVTNAANRHLRRCDVLCGGEHVAHEGSSSDGSRKEHRMSLLWIILIVVLVLALLGFFGRGRF